MSVSIPLVIFREVILPFLNVGDVVTLDSSLLNKELQLELREKLQKTTFENAPAMTLNTAMVSWFVKRKIYVTDVVLDGGLCESDVNVILELIKNATTVRLDMKIAALESADHVV